MDLSSCGGDESLERRGCVLAPSSVPAESSFDEGRRPTSASFVAGLFPRQKKRSYGEANDSLESCDASSAKKSVFRGQSFDSNSEAYDSGSLRIDDPKGCNVVGCISSPPRQLPSGDVDVLGFRKRKSSQSPQAERQDARRKLLKTCDSDEADLASSDSRIGSLSQSGASGVRPSVPASSHLDRNTVTATRRPKRFAAPTTLPPQQFVSTRKSSAAFYHPPIMTNGNSSRILSCSYREVLEDVAESQLTSGSYNEEVSDEEVEEGDGSLPILKCPLLPLVKRQGTEADPHFGKEGQSIRVRNYKPFRKVS